MATLDALPFLEMSSALSNDVFVKELSDNLTKEKITAAISLKQKGSSPGLDGISTEILKLGGAESVRWLEYCR